MAIQMCTQDPHQTVFNLRTAWRKMIIQGFPTPHLLQNVQRYCTLIVLPATHLLCKFMSSIIIICLRVYFHMPPGVTLSTSVVHFRGPLVYLICIMFLCDWKTWLWSYLLRGIPRSVVPSVSPTAIRDILFRRLSDVRFLNHLKQPHVHNNSPSN